MESNNKLNYFTYIYLIITCNSTIITGGLFRINSYSVVDYFMEHGYTP